MLKFDVYNKVECRLSTMSDRTVIAEFHGGDRHQKTLILFWLVYALTLLLCTVESLVRV
jgi:hypothetical protein